MQIYSETRKAVQDKDNEPIHQYHEHPGLIITSNVSCTVPGDNPLVIGADQCWSEFRALDKLRIQTKDDYALLTAGGMRSYAL